MAMYFYYAMLAVSLLLVVVYAFIFHKHFDVDLSILVTLVPIANLAFLLLAQAQSVDAAIVALKFTYIGGCFLLVTVVFLILKICGFNLKPWMKALILAVSGGIYVCCLTIGYSDIFYIGLPELATFEGATYLTNKSYGFMHTVFYVAVGLYYAGAIAAIIYSFFIKKKQVPLTILILLLIAVSVSIIGFFGGRFITNKIELLPATYNFGMIIYIIIAQRLRLYDASDSVTDSLVQKGETGFISFDSKMRYLGSNETAKEMFPELAGLTIDHLINENDYLANAFLPWVKAFQEDKSQDKHFITRNKKTYLIEVNDLMMGRFRRGYQFFLSDDTANQQYIELIKNYNEQLEKEVAHKTKSIIEMQDKLVLGMATMVEGRDNSTGGHIKRTSMGVRILVEEIQKDNQLGLSEQFCNNLIKAAPMHDLGKIAVDDQILRKPGKFTPEEFEVMKTHAAEGARIVSKILEGTDDTEFAKIAVNVAHFHHERVDGSGYPNKLKGDEIPLEARIMAIADVYDALVSKRVYKDKMSFDTANSIIMDGMGSQFDKQLQIYYERARAELEEYYSHTDC